MSEYDPPLKWAECYVAGFLCRLFGGKEEDNPHEESGHERDTTPQDERHMAWASGYDDRVAEERAIDLVEQMDDMRRE